MRIKKTSVAFVLMFCPAILFAQKKVTVSSPSKEISFSFHTEDGHPEYSVSYKGKALIQSSRLGLTFAGNDVFGDHIKTGKVTYVRGIDDYTLPEGKTSKVFDTYNEAYIPMQEREGKKWLIGLQVRVFNDGVASLWRRSPDHKCSKPKFE